MDPDVRLNIGRVAAFFPTAGVSGLVDLGTNFSSLSGVASVADDLLRYQQTSMTADKIRDILGQGFEQNYKSFEELYFNVVSDSKNLRKGVQADISLLKLQGRIDLSVLNYKEQLNLQKFFLENVLKQQELFKEVGLPGMIMPNANPTRMSMKYMIDNSEVTDIAQIMFNRLNFSIDPMTGSISIPKSNIPTLESLQSSLRQSQAFSEDFFANKRIAIFDVETTGVYRGSQVRSMSVAEMNRGVTKLVEEFDMAFESEKLRGFLTRSIAGGSEEFINFNRLLSIEEGTNLRAMGVGGKDFLDDASRFINHLLTYDAISAHNAGFDLDMITSTMRAMPAFASHENAQQALRELYGRINDSTREPFLIDTLDIVRNYLHKQAMDPRILSGQTTGVNLGDEVIGNLFDRKIIARAQTGGSAAYASVEAVAMNTNLLELIYSESPQLFDQQQAIAAARGSKAHQSSFDVMLQGEMVKYISQGRLYVRALSNLVDVDSTGASLFSSDIVAKAEKKRAEIFRSSALVPNLNIQDINMVSDETYRYLLRNQSGIRISDLAPGETIESILTAARGGEIAAQERILSLGINFYENTAAIETSRLMSQAGSISRRISDQTILDAYTITERMLGTKTSSIFMLGRDPSFPFSQGFTKEVDFDDTLSISRAFSTIGSPFEYLDTRSRMISASIAQITAPTAESVFSSISSNLGRMQELGFTALAKEMSSEGISYFDAGLGMRLFDSSMGTASKVQMPFNALREIVEPLNFGTSIDDIFSNLSLSVQDVAGSERVNLIWNVGKQASQDEVDNLTKRMFDLLSEGTPEELKIFDGIDILNEKAAVQKIKSQAAAGANIMQMQEFQDISQKIRERGIVLGTLGLEQSQALISSLRAQGLPMGAGEADTIISQWTARMLTYTEEHLIVGPFINETSAKINSIRYQGSKVIDYLNEIATHISDSDGLSKEILTEKRLAILTEDATSWARAYENIKPNLKIGAMAISAGIVGYYASSMAQERSLLNETIEVQPREIPGARTSLQSVQSHRMDPLITAGVVGNLDRNKTSHFRMGPNKYDHLYG